MNLSASILTTQSNERHLRKKFIECNNYDAKEPQVASMRVVITLFNTLNGDLLKQRKM